MAIWIETDGTRKDQIWLRADDAPMTWADFNAGLSALVTRVRRAERPMRVVYAPARDIPAGNPLPHLKRMLSIVENEANIRVFALALDWSQALTRSFVDVALRIYGDPPGFVMAESVDAALALIEDGA